MSASEPVSQDETANLHLQVGGEEHTFSIPVPLGKRTPLDLLPAARELTERLTQVAIDQVRAQGREVSCRAGCGACCRQLVAISLPEAQDLAELVASLPPERQAVIRARFAQAINCLEAAGLVDSGGPGGRALLAPNLGNYKVSLQVLARCYFEQHIACPFLENESCSIYARRPLVCREYHVTSPPEQCAQLYRVPVERVEVPVHMRDVLTQAAHRATGWPRQTIPLVFALEWAAAQEAVPVEGRDGLTLFQTLIAELDPAYDQAFDARDEDRPGQGPGGAKGGTAPGVRGG